MTDERHDPGEAMERFEDLGRRLFQVPKEEADEETNAYDDDGGESDAVEEED